jgi:hypothetical protein
MKKIVFLLLSLQSITVWAQWSDDFNDGRFQNEPNAPRTVNWTGDTDAFTIHESLQLQLRSNVDQSPVQLRTPSSLVSNTQWQWDLTMTFTPSSSNYAKIYLASDEPDLTGSLNGLFIRIGYTDKNICLVQSKNGGNNKILITGEKKRLDIAAVSLRIKATLDKTGQFHLYSQLETESDFRSEGSCTLQNPPTATWFGLVCTFTATRSQHFFFDNIQVQPLDDTPPDIEPPADLPRENDIVFTEIMANPGNESTYPEYIELYNTTPKTFHLKDCLFHYGDRPYALPDQTIGPHTHILLCKTTVVDAFPGLNAHGVASFPVLANSGKLLMLSNTDNEIIAWFEYSDTMYNDPAKKSGGWSLECIDPANRSNTAANWSASTDPSGGTPGHINSLHAPNPDTTPPALHALSFPDENRIRIVFTKPMDPNLLPNPQSYTLHPPAYQIVEPETNYPQATELTLQLHPRPPQGQLIELSPSGLRDRSGNPWPDTLSILLGHAFEALAGDLVINEILFNPPTGGNEYIELYNRSDKTLDLRYLSITSRKPSDGSFNKAYPLTSMPLFLPPQQYIVVTKDRHQVCPFFTCRPESFFVEPASMPSLANTSGCAVVLNNVTNEIVDELYYHESMHSKLLSGSKKGIALERIHYDLPSADANTWTSADAPYSHGTPGYINSRYSEPTGIDAPSPPRLTIEYPAPGDDRYIIRYPPNPSGANDRLSIYDSSGRPVIIAPNHDRQPAQGIVYWNGQDAGGRKLPPGIYIVYLERFDMQGNVLKFKVPLVMR